MKLSEDPEKSTLPGRKAIYRLLDTDGQDPFQPPYCCNLSYLTQ